MVDCYENYVINYCWLIAMIMVYVRMYVVDCDENCVVMYVVGRLGGY